MGILSGLDQAAGSLAQGLGQGMDLYAQYNEQKTKNEQAAKSKAISDRISQLSANNELSDPVQAGTTLSKLYYDAGMPEQGAQYTQYAEGARKTKADKHMMNAYIMGAHDPYGALDELNAANDVMGIGDKFRYERTPGGVRVHYKGSDGETTKDYDDPQRFHHDILDYMDVREQGIGKSRQTNAAIAKDTAAAAKDAESTRYMGDIANSQIAENLAQAGASRASAAHYSADTALKQAEAPAKQAETEARTGYYERGNEGKGPGEILKGLGLRANDGLSPPPEDATQDLGVVGPLAEGIHAEGEGYDAKQASTLALRLVGASEKLRVDVENGLVQEPGSDTPIKIGRSAAQHLVNIGTAGEE